MRDVSDRKNKHAHLADKFDFVAFAVGGTETSWEQPVVWDSSRSYGLSYSQFIYGLKKSNILLNRKVLAQIGVLDPISFKQILDLITQ